MLEIRNLTAFYGEVQALQDVNLDVKKGEIVCLIGKNGAGKSTTLLSISGIIQKKGGSIRFAGEEIGRLPAHRIVALGLSHVPEGRRIFPALTVEENLRLGGFIKAKIDAAKVEEMYGLFPVLKERRKQLGGSLSGGEQQMLAIGRALVGEPKLLMLDEPSLGLAPKLIDLIFDVIVNLRSAGMTILLIEQNAELALEVSDRAYVTELGKTVLSGDSADLKRDDRIRSIYFGEQ